MKIITPAELKQRIDKKEEIQVIDIREPASFEAGHIIGADCIPKNEIPQQVARISSKKMVVLYCAYGIKSDQAALYLKEKHKMKNVWVLEGGLYDYARDIDPFIVVV